ncbi:MAG: ferritin-like domain-containing protein [Thermomicrobiales bacterium]|nr:ferritin-like domain-containing protein [Thermomicrobiales bacterium]
MTTDLNRALQQLSIATFNRRRLLASAGITIGGAALAATPLMASAQADSTPTDGDDMSMFAEPVDVLNYALTLEHLEAAFYRDGLAAIGEAGITGLGFQASVYQQLMTIGDNEATHVATLTEVITDLGGEPVAEAMYDFGYADAAGFLQVALALEDTGVSAYQGAAQFLIGEDALLTAALTIHGNEARHAAYLGLLNAVSPFPESFNPTLTPEAVLEIAGPFIVG